MPKIKVVTLICYFNLGIWNCYLFDCALGNKGGILSDKTHHIGS